VGRKTGKKTHQLRQDYVCYVLAAAAADGGEPADHAWWAALWLRVQELVEAAARQRRQQQQQAQQQQQPAQQQQQQQQQQAQQQQQQPAQPSPSRSRRMQQDGLAVMHPSS
jgi:hypothetical protein